MPCTCTFSLLQEKDTRPPNSNFEIFCPPSCADETLESTLEHAFVWPAHARLLRCLRHLHEAKVTTVGNKGAMELERKQFIRGGGGGGDDKYA